MALGSERRSRSHAYAILNSFSSDFPAMGKWWPLPGDEEYLPDEKSETMSAKEFVSALGSFFRPN